jgi:hypothetical protein
LCNLIRDISILYVNTLAPELAPIFRSDSQGEILARLLLNPERAFTIADLAAMTQTSYASTFREVQRLARTGLLTEHRVGRHHQLSADTTSRAYQPLSELLRISYGPVTVLPAMLQDIGGIDQAFIYGSWAARRSGEKGSPPQDIDLLVVGNPSRAEVYGAAERAQQSLGVEVNPRIVSVSGWREASDPFIATVKERPLVPLLPPGLANQP